MVPKNILKWKKDLCELVTLQATETKGTQLIIDALDSLNQSGYRFEFILP